MTEPVVEHRLIVRQRQSPAVLLCAAEGAWALPSFVAPDHHTADVEFINTAVRERCGLDTTVLRCLDHREDANGGRVKRLFELESHTLHAALPAGWRWCRGDEVAGVAWHRPEDASALREWIGDQRAPQASEHRKEWTRPGWWDGARAWVGARLAQLGVPDAFAASQVRVWDSSCVFRIDTPTDTYYFKALPQTECAVTAYLAREVGGCAPDVVAVEARQRWLLMRAAPGANLEATTARAAWQAAIAAYAQLQVACMPRAGALQALGCRERPVESLPGHIEELLADTAALLPGSPVGLSVAEIDALRAAGPALQQRCAALRASGPPPSLDHGDLWPANILVDGTQCTVIDWEDAGIAPPFFSLAPLLVGARIYHPTIDIAALAQDLRGPYLDPFTAVAPRADMERAFDLARPLAVFEMAVRYWQQPASTVAMHPWMRELVPYLLRIVLEELHQ